MLIQIFLARSNDKPNEYTTISIFGGDFMLWGVISIVLATFIIIIAIYVRNWIRNKRIFWKNYSELDFSYETQKWRLKIKTSYFIPFIKINAEVLTNNIYSFRPRVSLMLFNDEKVILKKEPNYWSLAGCRLCVIKDKSKLKGQIELNLKDAQMAKEVARCLVSQGFTCDIYMKKVRFELHFN